MRREGARLEKVGDVTGGCQGYGCYQISQSAFRTWSLETSLIWPVGDEEEDEERRRKLTAADKNTILQLDNHLSVIMNKEK